MRRILGWSPTTARRDRRVTLIGALIAALGLALLIGAGSSSAQQRNALVQLTVDRSLDLRPVWSPDGSRVTYQNNHTGKYQVWTMNVDGSDARRLSQDEADDRHPVWSPDGKWIAFDAGIGRVREIWVMDVEGNNRRQLTALDGLSTFPNWSLDGRHIAFFLYQAGVSDLWVMDASGASARALTTGLADERKGSCTNACHRPAWSPDNQTIAFSGGDHRTIWTIDAASGANMSQITDGREHAHFPWYLPDGRIGYIAEHIQQGRAWTDVVVIDPANPALETRPLLGVSLQGPYEVSADGERVLFHSPRGGNFDIFMADIGAPGGMDALTSARISAQLAAGAPTPEPATSSAAASSAAAITAAAHSSTEAAPPPAPVAGVPVAAAAAAPAPAESPNLLQSVLLWQAALLVVLVAIGGLQYVRRARRRGR